MQHLYWLNQLQTQHRSLVGETAYTLGVASQAQYPVLPGIVVSSSSFWQFLESINWSDPLLADFPHSPLHLDMENPSQLQAIAQRIQYLIHAHSLPEQQQDTIYKAVQSLHSPLIQLQPSLSLASTQQTRSRKSADKSKDTIAPLLNSALPLLDTHICYAKRSALINAIRQIWSSFFRASHLFYWQQLGVPFQQLQLAILICPTTSALASGTLSVSHQKTIIKAVWGMGSGVKTGDIQPDIYYHQRHDYLENHNPPTPDPQPDIESPKIRIKRYAHLLAAEKPSDAKAEATSIESVYHLLSHQRAHQPVLSDPLIQYLTHLTQGLTHESAMANPKDWVIDWVIYPSWSVPSKEHQEPSPDNQPFNGWQHSESIFTRIDDSALDLTSLVLEQKQYAVYITQILANPREMMPSVATKNSLAPNPSRSQTSFKVASAVDIALEHQRSRARHWPVEEGQNTTAINSFSTDNLTSTEKLNSYSDLAGIGTSSGQVTAPLWVMPDTKSADQDIPDNHILLTNSISPVWLNAMRGAKGVISTKGGMTCHAAILARELGIPSVMGVTDAMTRFQTGDWIYLDGDRGIVTLLAPANSPDALDYPPENSTSHQDNDSSERSVEAAQLSPLYQPEQHGLRKIGTATQLMLSLSQIHQVDVLAQRPVDGIGLIRSEIMLASLLHHQSLQSWLTQDNRSLLVQTICYHIKQFAQAFSPRPVWYRTLDMRSHEQGHPPGHATVINNLLGVHGTMSYQQNPGFFIAELEALRQLQQEGIKNINIILPFVRTVEEFQFCYQTIREMDVDTSACDVWIMAEVPSVLMLLPDYIEVGIQGIAIGSNDLTQMMLATDRTNPMMHNAFHAPHQSVLRAIKQLIVTARQANIPCSLCGELASQHPEVIEDLIRWGITTLSVSPDALEQTHREVLRAEKRLFLEWGRNAHRNS
ncbi:MAG: putative PEP-binding protein [Cyanobacteria bacterium P01_F01_bin.150]